MRHPRILNRSAQADEAQGFEEGATDIEAMRNPATRAGAGAPQGMEPVRDIAIEVMKRRRRVARAKVLRPAAEHRIHVRNDAAEILVTPRAGRQGAHTSAHPRHRARGRPPMQEEDTAMRAFPNRSAHALVQVAAEKVEARATAREIDGSRLLRMQLEPETREHGAHALTSF